MPVPKYKRDLVHKLKILKQDFQSLQNQGGHCRLEVSREEIFEVSVILHFKGLNVLCFCAIARNILTKIHKLK